MTINKCPGGDKVQEIVKEIVKKIVNQDHEPTEQDYKELDKAMDEAGFTEREKTQTILGIRDQRITRDINNTLSDKKLNELIQQVINNQGKKEQDWDRLNQAMDDLGISKKVQISLRTQIIGKIRGYH